MLDDFCSGIGALVTAVVLRNVLISVWFGKDPNGIRGRGNGLEDIYHEDLDDGVMVIANTYL